MSRSFPGRSSRPFLPAVPVASWSRLVHPPILPRSTPGQSPVNPRSIPAPAPHTHGLQARSGWLHFWGGTVFDGGVAWVFLVVSIAFAVLVVNAYRPVKREPFTVASFALGWIPGELPLHVGAFEVAAATVFTLNGGLHSWPGW